MIVLYIGELVGKAGIFALKTMLGALKQETRADIVIANGNGTTGGAGIGKAHALYIKKLGVDVITTGEAAFYKIDIVEAFPKNPWLLRPLNYPPGVPGRGYKIYATQAGPLCVVSMLGQAGFTRVHLDNPFHVFDAMYKDFEAVPIVLDFRAPTTAERRAMIQYVDGRVGAVIGSFGRALSADAEVSPRGTASVTDSGRTGSLISVGGMDAQARIQEFRTSVPVWAKDAAEGIELQGCVIHLNAHGKASEITTLRIPCKEQFVEGTGHNTKH